MQNTVLREQINAYIKANWVNTIHPPEDVTHGMVKLEKPFTVPNNWKNAITTPKIGPDGKEYYPEPSTNIGFPDFYYWDTYFTNKGLLLDDMSQQAENNLDNIAYFIRNLGYMPNANHLLDRSQPPFFTAGVYELYLFKKDSAVIRKYIDTVLAELEFWRMERTTPIGLSRYGNNATRATLNNVSWLCERVGEPLPDTEEGRIRLCDNLYAIAESGWDFNPRFPGTQGRFSPVEYAHLDLNCILYDAQCKAAEMLRIVGREQEAQKLEQAAVNRKELMIKYLRDPESGVFYDYNFVTGKLSPVLSAASMYVYAMGISEDAAAAKKVLEKLELAHGISACAERSGEEYLQWDYPAVWPTNNMLSVQGLQRIGLEQDAARVGEKYLATMEHCFEKTGVLWEKYDGALGDVSITREYETPSMMGWSAASYLVIQNMLKD